MKSKEEIEQLAENSSEVQEATYTSQHKITYQHGYIDGYTQCQKDITNEIQSLIDGYKSYILRLEEKFKDTCSALTLEKIVTLESIVENLESKLKQN
jgi:flagellar biosynthesis/type III secretory pathway protein FliH